MNIYGMCNTTHAHLCELSFRDDFNPSPSFYFILVEQRMRVANGLDLRSDTELLCLLVEYGS